MREGFLRGAMRVLIAGALLLLTGCDAVVLEKHANEALTPAPAGTGRIIFYRTADFEDTQSMPTVYLNGAATGISQDGALFYRDMQPGTYNVTVAPTLPFQNQFPTITVKAGDIVYLHIATLGKMGDMTPTERSYADTFILSVVDPQQGAYQTYGLRHIQG